MIKPELYHKTVGILYDAYFNDTLEHENCFACAVGNIIAANMGKKFCIDPSVKTQKFFWEGYAPYSDFGSGKEPEWFPLTWVSPNNQEVISTGYSQQELVLIEKAFERARGKRLSDKKMFNGLVGVLNVLKRIHRVTDKDLLQANNKRFKDHYAKRVSAV